MSQVFLQFELSFKCIVNERSTFNFTDFFLILEKKFLIIYCFDYSNLESPKNRKFLKEAEYVPVFGNAQEVHVCSLHCFKRQ